ncbi:D-alanyl-D-alanine carboxypeptidase family protein [Microbacterium sp. 179-B 1A2 NHS]|uniref:M15 family metallopeptidase n=1 Tax=Microbacterium sp. 179-B 1A2 NHS TaxID=3142383 RepID=UPI0039A3658F
MALWGRRIRTVALTAVLVMGASALQASAAVADPAPAVSAAASPVPAPSASPSPEPVTVYGYYRTPWTTDQSVYEVRTDGSVRRLSVAQWDRLGKPKRAVAPVSYVRASWSRTVYGLLTWPHHKGDRAVDDVVTLDAAALRSVGTPTSRVVGHVPTTRYSRYVSGPKDLYARTPDGVRHLLTARERAAAGSPKPHDVVPGGYYRAKWSKNVHFVAASGAQRVISAATYAAAGKPQVSIAPTVYARTPWSSTVHALITWPHRPGDRSVDQVVRLTAATYAAAGRPRTTTRYRIPGDSFVRLTVGDTVYHRLSGTLTPVTASQWRAAGSPKVRSVRPAKPAHIRDILIVNKSLPLPSSYGNGLRPELTRAFSTMKAAARKDGVSLTIISGFRSYATQKSVFASKVRQHGRAAAEKRSARPGHSEHQTGLAIDVNSISQAWGETKAGRWVAKHGPEYGFIVRYPKGKEKVTGYRWEPWHLRYVGTAVAKKLTSAKLTLEEYLRVPSRY